MDDLQIKICRLCLDLITNDKYDSLEGSLKMMLGIITPDLKFDITNNPVICKECSNCIQLGFDFKTNFFEVEEIIETKKEENQISNAFLSDLMKGGQSKKSSQLISYCRTCLFKIEAELFVDFKKDTEKKNVLLLQNCLFEMDTTLTSDCKICLICFGKLQAMNKFKINCMENEEKIDIYLKKNPLKEDAKLNLLNIISLPIKQENNIIDIIKIEPEIQQFDKSSITIKNEKVDMGIDTNSNPMENMMQKVYFEAEPCRKDSEGKTWYKCPEPTCSFTTKYKQNIQPHLSHKHQKNVVLKGKRFYKCTECDYHTVKNFEMMKHLLTHAKIDDYKCTTCSYTNHQKTELVKHIFSHVDHNSVKNYQILDKKRKKCRK